MTDNSTMNNTMISTMNARKKAVKGEADAVARRQAVVELVAGQSVGSQAELAELLTQRGFQVTQATLSRDLKALGIGKIPARGGYTYVLPSPHQDEVADEEITPLSLDSYVKNIKLVNNLVLVRTVPGQAHNVGRLVEGLDWAEVEGTICGDDTLMVVTRGADQAQSFSDRFASLAPRRTA